MSNKALQFQAMPNYQFAVLPAGIHHINENELDNLFVKPFPYSSTRPLIARNFERFRKIIQSVVASEQWVNGSFVESKENPNDLDVAIWVDANEWKNVPDKKQKELLDFCHMGKIAKKALMIDAYIMPVFDANHPQYALHKNNWNYWRDLFSHTRSKQPKGFIHLNLPLATSM